MASSTSPLRGGVQAVHAHLDAVDLVRVIAVGAELLVEIEHASTFFRPPTTRRSRAFHSSTRSGSSSGYSVPSGCSPRRLYGVVVTTTCAPVEPRMSMARRSSPPIYASKPDRRRASSCPSLTRSTVSHRPTISSATSGLAWLIRCAQRCGQDSHSGFWVRVSPVVPVRPAPCDATADGGEVDELEPRGRRQIAHHRPRHRIPEHRDGAGARRKPGGAADLHRHLRMRGSCEHAWTDRTVVTLPDADRHDEHRRDGRRRQCRCGEAQLRNVHGPPALDRLLDEPPRHRR